MIGNIKKIRNIAAVGVAASLVVGVLTLGFSVPVNAQDDLAAETLSALEAVTDQAGTSATDVLANVADVVTDSSGDTAIEATVAGVEVIVPTDPSDQISLESSTGDVLSIGLPFADKATDATVVTDGVVAYDNKNLSTTAVVVKQDGSVQITVVIEGPTAPTKYPYELNIPSDATVSIGDNGGVTILDADGTFLGGIASAWAKDATGVSVPTHYVLNGSVLTQVVEHTTARFVYPIVADPWFGIKLIERTAWYPYFKPWKLQVYPTGWLKAAPLLYATLWTRFILSDIRDQAWKDIKSMTPGGWNLSPSMRDQFYCHFDFWALGTVQRYFSDTNPSVDPSWDLEMYRPYVSYPYLVSQSCNN